MKTAEEAARNRVMLEYGSLLAKVGGGLELAKPKAYEPPVLSGSRTQMLGMVFDAFDLDASGEVSTAEFPLRVKKILKELPAGRP